LLAPTAGDGAWSSGDSGSRAGADEGVDAGTSAESLSGEVALDSLFKGLKLPAVSRVVLNKELNELATTLTAIRDGDALERVIDLEGDRGDRFAIGVGVRLSHQRLEESRRHRWGCSLTFVIVLHACPDLVKVGGGDVGLEPLQDRVASSHSNSLEIAGDQVLRSTLDVNEPTGGGSEALKNVGEVVVNFSDSQTVDELVFDPNGILDVQMLGQSAEDCLEPSQLDRFLAGVESFALEARAKFFVNFLRILENFSPIGEGSCVLLLSG